MASAVCLPRVVEAETRRIELRGVIYKVTKECAVVANHYRAILLPKVSVYVAGFMAGT
jgi:hypothetical protein